MSERNTAEALRDAFDRSFAETPGSTSSGLTDLLAVTVGGDPYTFRLADVVSLHRDRVIVPLVRPAAPFMGLAAFRGLVAPVYDLRAMLGYAAGAPLPWLVLCRAGDARVGLAFDQFDAHVQAAEETGAARGHLAGVARAAGATRPIIHVASLLEALRQKER